MHADSIFHICSAGHNAVYRSPTPSVPLLPLAPALQPAPAHSRADAGVSEAHGHKQPASAPTTCTENRAATEPHIIPTSQVIETSCNLCSPWLLAAGLVRLWCNESRQRDSVLHEQGLMLPFEMQHKDLCGVN